MPSTGWSPVPAGGPVDERPPPEITVLGEPAVATETEPVARRGGSAALVVAALVLLFAVVRSEQAPPPPVPQLDAELTLVPDAVSITQSGILVIPVLLQDRGAGLRVLSAAPYAEPVREDPIAQPPLGVAAGQSRRFVVLVAPDCRLLTPRSGLDFRASLLLRIAGSQDERQLGLDLATDPAVAGAVAGLCRRD